MKLDVNTKALELQILNKGNLLANMLMVEAHNLQDSSGLDSEYIERIQNIIDQLRDNNERHNNLVDCLKE